LLFHGGRFRQLGCYRILTAQECLAEIGPERKTQWFSPYLPADLVLGDPAARDAAIHSIQACIPHVPLLPTGIERLSLKSHNPNGPVFVRACERSSDGKEFVYDLSVTDEQGNIHEHWEGLRLKAVANAQHKVSWSEPLLIPYLERRIHDLIPHSDVSLTLVRDQTLERQMRSAHAFQKLLGENADVKRRPDGRPEVNGQQSVSAAHHEDLTLAVAGLAPIGCDLEPLVDRPPCVWRAFLGEDRISLVQLINRRVDEESLASATRVWAATECLKKAGGMPNAPLVFRSATDDGWVSLLSGPFAVLTYLTRLQRNDEKLVLAILTKETNECLRVSAHN
jgi:enediyne polyketide synthase